jgi:signal transduction histidine kinase
VIIEQANKIMNTTNCSIFLIDEQGQYLESFISTDLKKEEIRIPKDYGVAGWVFRNRTPVIIDDPYRDPRFYPEVDKKTGFKTKCILCVPLINRNNNCIGTLQVLNKKDSPFTDDDLEILTYVSNYVTIALENSMIYEELKASDTAKQKVINHLSHELKTPLAIISSAFLKLSKSVHGNPTPTPNLLNVIERGQRNVSRLFAIQEKVDDIINRKSTEEQHMVTRIFESIEDFVDELREEEKTTYRNILERISNRINSIFQMPEIQLAEIELDTFLDALCSKILSSVPRNDLKIRTHFQEGLVIQTDRNVLEKVCTGLLKNAIENTPDEGFIEIRAFSEGKKNRIEFRDYGVGITQGNRKHIFAGFFHTQDTEAYSSKRPFDFNAGGSGSDLLRIKMFSERFGFELTFESNRCRFIPTDSDLCPGKISLCPHVQNESGCLSSGGSTFSVIFPKFRTPDVS